MRVDCFYRTWNRDKVKTLSPGNVRVIQVEVAEGAGVEAIVFAALQAGASKGNGRTGIYEIQTDYGLWFRLDEGPLCDAQGRRRKGVVFMTWEELETSDLAVSPPLKTPAPCESCGTPTVETVQVEDIPAAGKYVTMVLCAECQKAPNGSGGGA